MVPGLEDLPMMLPGLEDLPTMLEGAMTNNDTVPCRLLAQKLLDSDVAAEPRLPLYKEYRL